MTYLPCIQLLTLEIVICLILPTYLQGRGIVDTNCTTGAVKVLVAEEIHWASTVPPIPIIAFYKIN